jgi:hypothetical protein
VARIFEADSEVSTYSVSSLQEQSNDLKIGVLSVTSSEIWTIVNESN